MKKAIIVLGLFAAALTSAHAGALFDDYLNYVRPGAATGPGNIQVTVSSGSAIGQSFTVPTGTGEIYRIGIRPVFETWGKGEKVIMTIFDSAGKKKKLGQATIDEAGSHIQPFDENYNKDKVLYFHFRKPVDNLTKLYFELDVTGGDGKISFQAFGSDAYPDGECISGGSAKDLSFDCHIKPIPDKDANLKQFFTERLDISRPELTAVKAAVDAKDWEKAIAEAAKHFRSRTDAWPDYKDWGIVKNDPNADTAKGDRLMNWVPRYPVSTSALCWDPDRDLAFVYDESGKEQYARKAIDLRMQMIIDNPVPKRSGIPRFFHLWNDRMAAGRAPGYGTLVFARLYNYPGWTNDEILTLFSFFEENALWCYEAASGANWGAEAARGAYEFALKFPEWKISPDCLSWGSMRLAEIALGDVRSDGTSSEASVKYHGMVARRLKGLIEHCQKGQVSFDKELYARLMKRLEDMYEHMMYSMQPDVCIGADRKDHFAVMYGDSFNENYSGEVADVGKMVNRPDFIWAATQGKEGLHPKEISKVYPDGGYFIMRSDFGGPGRNYTDARQLFVHNGDWSGSHAHWDHMAINGLYAYGRPLVVDPGQYMGGNETPPPGYDRYWSSSIHSTLVMDGRDMKESPGPNEWTSNSVIDWLDGRHSGYGNIGFARRRIAFIKPDYFLVDDSIEKPREADWAQMWNLTDTGAKADPVTKTIETQYADGGNLMILNQDPETITLSEKPGFRTGLPRDKAATKIFGLHRKTDKPRFKTLLYPYKTGAKPDVNWERILPDDQSLGNMFYSLRIRTNNTPDWAVFGESGKMVSYRKGSHKADAEFAFVRMNAKGEPQSFSWARGRELVFSGKTLAKSGVEVVSLGVKYEGARLVIEAKEADPSLAVKAGMAKTVVVNGKSVTNPVIKNGMCYPFASMPQMIVADDRDSFERVTAGEEWARVPDPNSFSAGYTQHETDPGRHEEGNYVFNVSKSGRYSVEVFLPKISMIPSDRVEYKVIANGSPAAAGGAIVNVKQDENVNIFTLNQQSMAGWVKLGEFFVNQGQFKINARNITETDGIYFTADAVRLVAK